MAGKKYKIKTRKTQASEPQGSYGKHDIVFSKHALAQMELRGISKAEAEVILKSPQEVKEENGKKVFQSVTENGNYLIRIFVNDNVIPAVIITVYKTSKISKYYEGKI